MAVDPNLVPLLQLMDAAPPMSQGTAVQAREAFRMLTVTLRDPATIPPIAHVEDSTIAGVPVRVYRPDGDGPRPTVVYVHGGGFVIGDLDTHDATCRRLANDIGAVVVSVDYRLAPEHAFPAAVEDSWAVLQAVAAQIEQFGDDATRLVVGGDSAGGNLSAVCAQLARDTGLPLAAQLLVYPVTDALGEYASATENASGYFLTRDDMEWFAVQYAGMDEASARTSDLAQDIRLSPLHGNLDGLAPAVVVTAQYDPLRDDGNAYAAALEAAGVTVRHRQFDGLIHGFYGMEHISPTIDAATAWTNEALRTLLESATHPA